MPTHGGSSSATYNASAGITVSWPTYSAGQQAFLWVQTKNIQVPTPSGWTELLWVNNGVTPGTASALGVQIFGKIVEASEASVTIDATGSFIGGFISVFSSVDTAAPVDGGFVTDIGQFSTPTGTFAALLKTPVTYTSYDDGLFLFLCCNTTDSASTSFSALTSRHPWLNFVSEYRDSNTSTGTGGGFSLNGVTVYYAGASGDNYLQFLSASGTNNFIQVAFALKDSSPTGGPYSAGYAPAGAIGAFDTLPTGVGIAEGASEVTATGIAVAEGVGTSTGTSIVNSLNFPTYTGEVVGSCTVAGVGIAAVLAAGATVGTSNVTASNLLLLSAGTAAGTSSVIGLNANFIAVGTGVGIGSASALTGYIGFYHGRAAGTSTATAGWANLAPGIIISGYSFDGTALTIPLTALAGLSAAEANATTGDWRAVFQELCLAHQAWYDTIPAASRPQTIHSFMLENWAKVSPVFGRTVYRKFACTFVTDNTPPNVFEPE